MLVISPQIEKMPCTFLVHPPFYCNGFMTSQPHPHSKWNFFSSNHKFLCINRFEIIWRSIIKIEPWSDFQPYGSYFTSKLTFLRRHPSWKTWKVLKLGCRSLLPLLCENFLFSPIQSPKNHRWRHVPSESDVTMCRLHLPSPSAVVFLHSDWLLMM